MYLLQYDSKYMGTRISFDIMWTKIIQPYAKLLYIQSYLINSYIFDCIEKKLITPLSFREQLSQGKSYSKMEMKPLQEYNKKK